MVARSSALSWAVGDALYVEVLSADGDANRLALSSKQISQRDGRRMEAWDPAQRHYADRASKRERKRTGARRAKRAHRAPLSRLTNAALSPWGAVGGGEVDDGDGEEYSSDHGHLGSSSGMGSDMEELMCQGIKPWDEDASAALAVLYGGWD